MMSDIRQPALNDLRLEVRAIMPHGWSFSIVRAALSMYLIFLTELKFTHFIIVASIVPKPGFNRIF
jgi:hypothetical protein